MIWKNDFFRPRPRFQAVFYFCSILALCELSDAAAQAQSRALIGVNVTNPQWRSSEERARLLDELQSEGVTLIRVPAVPDSSGDMGPTVAFIAEAYARGIRTQFNIWPAYRAGTVLRPRMAGTLATWDQAPLSSTWPALTAMVFRDYLRRLESRGVVLAGIELGNEINWTPFNGDFDVPGRGAVFDLKALETDPAARRIAAGYDAYLKALEAVKEVRNTSRLNAKTPLISAGLSDAGPPHPPTGSGPDAVGLEATLEYLRARGLDDLVDGYGVHTYVGPGFSPEARLAHLATKIFSLCSQERPCWLNEWGVEWQSQACPTHDAEAQKMVSDLRRDLDHFVQKGVVAALIYYEWRGDDKKYDIYRCGGLTPTGRAALNPQSPTAGN